MSSWNRFAKRIALSPNTQNKIKEQFKEAFNLSDQTLDEFTLGKIWKTIRELAGLSHAELAKASGIAIRKIPRIEGDNYTEGLRFTGLEKQINPAAEYISIRPEAPAKAIKD